MVDRLLAGAGHLIIGIDIFQIAQTGAAICVYHGAFLNRFIDKFLDIFFCFFGHKDFCESGL